MDRAAASLVVGIPTIRAWQEPFIPRSYAAPTANSIVHERKKKTSANAEAFCGLILFPMVKS